MTDAQFLETFNRTTVECKYERSWEGNYCAKTFNRTTVECKSKYYVS